MNIAAMSIWLRPLGWALFHSLWQGFIICLICKLCFILWSQRSSVRYFIAFTGLSILFLTFIGTFIYQLSTPGQFSVQVTNVPVMNFTHISTARHWWSIERLTAEFDQCLTLLVIVYLLILGFLSFSMLRNYNRLDQFRNKRYRYLPGISLENIFNNACRLSKLKRSVQIYCSELVTTPLTIGFLKPIILIPMGMMSQLSPNQVEAIFLHELAHIRRNDYLLNLFQVAIETILFFNPFSVILDGMIRTERENCCDDYVIAGGVSSLDYAHALLSLEEMRTPPPALSMGLGSKPGQLYQRIKRITKIQAPAPFANQILTVFIIILIGFSSFAFLDTTSFSQKTAHTVQLSLPQLPGLPKFPGLPQLPALRKFPSYFTLKTKVIIAKPAPAEPKAPPAPLMLKVPKAPAEPTALPAPLAAPKAPPAPLMLKVRKVPAEPTAPPAPLMLKLPKVPAAPTAPPAPPAAPRDLQASLMLKTLQAPSSPKKPKAPAAPRKVSKNSGGGLYPKFYVYQCLARFFNTPPAASLMVLVKMNAFGSISLTKLRRRLTSSRVTTV